MASAKPVSSARRPASRGPEPIRDPQISPARWAGVALVIAAILSASVLAMVSPSGVDDVPGVVETAQATPDPSASPGSTRVPAVKPTIVVPSSGVTKEIDIEVTVDVPAEAIPRRDLALVILRDGVEITRKDRPKKGGEVVVPGVRLHQDGPSELTAALSGPGGLGPVSDPVLMTVDRDAPGLEITAPDDKARTFEDVVILAGRSEPGSGIAVASSTGWSIDLVAGATGIFDVPVPLKVGRNEITVASQDSTTGVRQIVRRVVVRQNGNPKVALKKVPKSVKRSSLPRTLNLVVVVTDSSGARMEGARVSWSLAGTGRLAETSEDLTDAKGRSTWPVQLTAVPGNEPALLAVTVTSPYGKTRTITREIAIS